MKSRLCQSQRAGGRCLDKTLRLGRTDGSTDLVIDAGVKGNGAGSWIKIEHDTTLAALNIFKLPELEIYDWNCFRLILSTLFQPTPILFLLRKIHYHIMTIYSNAEKSARNTLA